MRLIILTFLSTWFFVAPATAQRSITLQASPVPIVDAEINGRPIRLEVDLRMPEVLVLSRAAAERLGVRQLPIGHVQVGIDGSGALLRGRIARPRIIFAGRGARALTGVFAVPVSTRADGVIGPAVLPYDVITIELGPNLEGARDIVLPMSDPDLWGVHTEVGGRSLSVDFDLWGGASTFNRVASRRFDEEGAIISAGELMERPVILGLTAQMQPVNTALTVFGLALAPTFARTDAPLLGALDEETIVVEASSGRPRPPRVTLGREALSRCSSISVNRPARQLTLRCAP